MNSFLKWPGGKTWFINKYSYLFTSKYNNYIEPFLGGGSVFFNIEPNNAVLSDKNHELINLYEVMRDSHDELKEYMVYHNKRHSKEYYYRVRELEPYEEIEKAARMLYLNRTCFNGLYRVNKNGKFNVPIGTKINCIYDIDMFQQYSKLLERTKLLSEDFSKVINLAMKNDLIFADPPYTVTHNQNSFIKYNETLFSWEDQLRLLDELDDAKNRGAKVISTNAYNDVIIKMYKERNFHITKLERYSNLSSNISNRRITQELLITSFKPNRNKKI